MEPVISSSSESAQRASKLPSMYDFMKEQEEMDSPKGAEGGALLTTSNLTKKQRKAFLQGERERFEAERKAQKAAAESERIGIEQQARDAVEEMGATNWVGRLLEYRQAHPAPGGGGLTFTEEVLNLTPIRFVCSVMIHESLQHFGKVISFSNKKDAKQYAAKKAVDWLVGNGFMPVVGVKFQKAPLPPTVKTLGPVQSTTPSPVGPPKQASSITYAGQIPELCLRLGFNTPTYEITKLSDSASFWNGYAHFGGDPRIEGKFGEVKNVFGKGNAKEQIAKEVFLFLKGIERQRMEMEDADEEDSERERESVRSDFGETLEDC